VEENGEHGALVRPVLVAKQFSHDMVLAISLTTKRCVFMTERGAPTPAGFRKCLALVSVAAKFPFPIHPHMLRHACGYKLAND